MGNGLVEVHCHILPGVDDGAKSMKEALTLLRMEYNQGVRKVILTPNCRRGYFETSRDTVEKKFQELKGEVSRNGMDLELYLGCEFYRENEIGKKLSIDQRLRMAGTNYVLLEFSPGDMPDTILRYTLDLIMVGFFPVIAHAERYRAMRELDLVRRLVDAGAYIQINAGSILGDSGWLTKRFCKRLFREGYVHLIGSDAHDFNRRPPCLGFLADYLNKTVGLREMERLLIQNPETMLSGNAI